MYVFTSYNYVFSELCFYRYTDFGHGGGTRLDDVPKTLIVALLIERDATRWNPPPPKLRDHFRIIDAAKQYIPTSMDAAGPLVTPVTVVLQATSRRPASKGQDVRQVDENSRAQTLISND